MTQCLILYILHYIAGIAGVEPTKDSMSPNDECVHIIKSKLFTLDITSLITGRGTLLHHL